ncbi:MAG: four helix bundle protein [Ignavibacteriales bacterium]|nr:four helix bundle protein [Ignavibacteriales bacterium]
MGHKDNIVREKAFEFAVRIVKLNKFLVKEKTEFVLSKQILRSGTSVGANIEEADNAISKKDFSSRISIAYKEAKETKYWLRLLKATDYISEEQSSSLLVDCDEICRLLFSILKTSRLTQQTK